MDTSPEIGLVYGVRTQKQHRREEEEGEEQRREIERRRVEGLMRADRRGVRPPGGWPPLVPTAKGDRRPLGAPATVVGDRRPQWGDRRPLWGDRRLLQGDRRPLEGGPATAVGLDPIEQNSQASNPSSPPPTFFVYFFIFSICIMVTSFIGKQGVFLVLYLKIMLHDLRFPLK